MGATSLIAMKPTIMNNIAIDTNILLYSISNNENRKLLMETSTTDTNFRTNLQQLINLSECTRETLALALLDFSEWRGLAGF